MIRLQTNLALRVRGAGGFSIDHANAHWRLGGSQGTL